jgi:hypothetical protein
MTTEASAPRRKLSAIVMVDVSGFSRMMGRNEEQTTALIREFHDRTRRLVETHQGRVVDTAGDSVFPLLANEWYPAIRHEAVREETDAPAEQRPESPVDFRRGHEVDNVQENVDRHEDSGVEIECSNFSYTTACTLIAILIVGPSLLTIMHAAFASVNCGLNPKPEPGKEASTLQVAHCHLPLRGRQDCAHSIVSKPQPKPQ